MLVLALTATACGGGGGGNGNPAGDLASDRPLATGLMLLPDEPAFRRHVLVADLERLRAAYPLSADLREALVGVWLPDALASAGRELWDERFGLRLGDISFFASAGFHPSEVAVAQGEFSPERIRGALRRSRLSGGGRASARPGSRRLLRPWYRSGQARAECAQPRRRGVKPRHRRVNLGADPRGAIAVAVARDEPWLRRGGRRARSDHSRDRARREPRPAAQRGPHEDLSIFPARLVAVGIDDLGPRSRTAKIALVYESAEQARSDAAVIERELPSATFPGGRGAFADIAQVWRVSAQGTAIVVTALLPPGADSSTWRLLVEAGDLGSLVRPQT